MWCFLKARPCGALPLLLYPRHSVVMPLVRRSPADDQGKLRRFYLHWSLKEAYVKAIGQGLGYDLRRISFVPGDWIDCCNTQQEEQQRPQQRGRSSSPTSSLPEEAKGRGNVDETLEASQRGQTGQRCFCPRSLAAVATAAGLRTKGGASGIGSVDSGGIYAAGGDSSWGQEDRLGCECGIGVVAVEVSSIMPVRFDATPCAVMR